MNMARMIEAANNAVLQARMGVCPELPEQFAVRAAENILNGVGTDHDKNVILYIIEATNERDRYRCGGSAY